MTFVLAGMVALSGYGLLVPADVRCALPGAVGCSGGILGAPAAGANSTNEQFFNVTMCDYCFWIINTANGTNETKSWNVFEGWTIHINATSLKADASVGGTAYHGLGVEINATGQQLMDLSAPVGRWVSGTFTAPSHVYRHQHIWCTIECGNGHGSMYLYNLNVVPSTSVPSVSVKASPSSGNAPLAVTFTVGEIGGTAPFTYSWNFGDGSSGATVANTSHTYSQSGTYSAVLSVTDSLGFKGSGSAAITVTTAASLTALASGTPTSGVAPLTVQFSGSASGGSSPYTYGWTFGDGTTGSGANPSHVYTAPGVYAAVLTVMDASSTTATSTVSLTVTAATGHFDVTASASPAAGSAPQAVSFSASSIGGTAPVSYSWSFGDGTTGTGASVSHTYSINGYYECTVFASDSAGRVGMNFTAVSVGGSSGFPLQALLSESPPSGSPPLTTNATVSIEGGTGPYGAPSWSFGDGTTATGNVVAHEFTTVGTYNVSVRVSDSTSATATAWTLVRAGGLDLTIALNRTMGDAPFAVGAAASVIGGSGSYQPVSWTWGDSNSSTGDSVNHTYGPGSTGLVTISATVSDSKGASATANRQVRIFSPPVAVLSTDAPAVGIPPVEVNFSLTVTGGSGNYTATPLWDFGDGSTTRGPSPQNHTYLRSGDFKVTLETNDSVGVVAIATAWVNISGGAAATGGGSSGPVWSFTGVGNPDQAALALIGIVALSGLGLLYRNRVLRARTAARSGADRPPTPSRPLLRPPKPPSEPKPEV